MARTNDASQEFEPLPPTRATSEQITRGEFNQALKALKDVVQAMNETIVSMRSEVNSRMEDMRSDMNNQIADLRKLHLGCMQDQMGKAYTEGREAQRITDLAERVTAIEDYNMTQTKMEKEDERHRKQLKLSIGLAVFAGIMGFVPTIFNAVVAFLRK